MITEDYVSFETAKLLKDKGFNKDTYTMSMYDENGEAKDVLLLKEGEEPVLRPTLQMAMKWLREVHNITIGITFSCGIISYEIEKNGEFITSIGSSRTYEQIVEEAIQLCVKTLI